jgi:hypothetical protein
MIATMIVSNFNTKKKTLGIKHQQRIKWSSISNIKGHMPIDNAQQEGKKIQKT